MGKNLSVQQAKQQAQRNSLSKAVAHFENLCSMVYPPKGSVFLRGMILYHFNCVDMLTGCLLRYEFKGIPMHSADRKDCGSAGWLEPPITIGIDTGGQHGGMYQVCLPKVCLHIRHTLIIDKSWSVPWQGYHARLLLYEEQSHVPAEYHEGNNTKTLHSYTWVFLSHGGRKLSGRPHIVKNLIGLPFSDDCQSNSTLNEF